MGWTYCPTSSLIVQVKILLDLHCKFSAVSFAVVRIPATSSVVRMLPLLSTWTIIIFDLVFLGLFSAYLAITGKIYLPSCLISWTRKCWKITPPFLLPLLTVASPSLGLAAAYSEEGPERDSQCGQGEAWRKLPRNCFLGEQGTRELWNVLTGLMLRCFPKKVGQSCHPHNDWYSLPQGEDCSTHALHPYWQRNGAYWHREGLVGGQLSLGQVWLKRLEALAEVCEAKNGVRILSLFVIELNLITAILGRTKALLAALVLLHHKKSSKSFHRCRTLEFPFSFSASFNFSTEFELLMACDCRKQKEEYLAIWSIISPIQFLDLYCGSWFLLVYWSSVSHTAIWVGSIILFIRTNGGSEMDETNRRFTLVYSFQGKQTPYVFLKTPMIYLPD